MAISEWFMHTRSRCCGYPQARTEAGRLVCTGCLALTRCGCGRPINTPGAHLCAEHD